MCTRFRRRRSGLKGAAVLCTMQYRSSSREGGGKKTAQFFTVCRSVLGHQLPIDISLPVYAQQCLSVPARPVGPCAVRRARCRSSSEVNVPVHDLQAVAVLRLRATVLAIFTRNTLAHPSLPRVHRAPIGPSSTQRDTTETKRDNRAQLLTQHRGMPHTRRLRPAKISNHHRATAPARGTRSTPRSLRSRIAHYCPTSTHVHTPRLPLAYADRRPTRSIIGFKELNDSRRHDRACRWSLVTGHWSLECATRIRVQFGARPSQTLFPSSMSTRRAAAVRVGDSRKY